MADAVIMVRLFSELWSAGVVMVATSNREPDELYQVGREGGDMDVMPLGWLPCTNCARVDLLMPLPDSHLILCRARTPLTGSPLHFQDGINRPYFLPFIGLLSRQCLVVHVDSSTDHRYGFERLPGSYHHPLGRYGVPPHLHPAQSSSRAGQGVHADVASMARATDEALDRAFLEMAGGPGKPTSIAVMMGRRLSVPEARAGVCRFSFDQLCKADVFAADYKVRWTLLQSPECRRG